MLFIAVAKLTQSEEKWKVIDISECNSQDLLQRLNGKMNETQTGFEFTQIEGALITALNKNENIILKGQFSPKLADALAGIILAKQANRDGGKLILISSDTQSFNYAQVEDHVVTVKDKRIALSNMNRFSSEKINALITMDQESLSQSIARLSYPEGQNNRDPWQGLKGLLGNIHLKEFDPIHSQKISDEFIQLRKDAVNSILQNEPYVFLTGLTGVGKSTFVEKDLIGNNSKLYKGESAMREWANDSSNNRKILFIDEANISNRNWSEFEGLYNSPPSIVVDGIYYPLTEKHKVVFAGNPLNYGGERKLASFFERHGNALIFEPMPQEFIYEKILKPIFVNTPLEKHSLDISQEILKMYRFLCECSSDSVLISPRELQMMALLVLSHVKENPLVNNIRVARHYAFLIGQPLTPEANQQDLFKKFPAAMLRHTKVENKPHHFHITASRAPLYQQLNDLTTLREYKRSRMDLNDEKKYGGLGGIVIEGDPGIGKSELVVSHLKAHGYNEVQLSTENVSDKAFYIMPVSMSFEEKKKLLLKAFDEGAVVIIDEINSSPMMERLLNDLLMGKNPEKMFDEDKRPKHPGFMIIGTQNPVTMEGRFASSNALSRRLMSISLPPYHTYEMEKILVTRGVNHIVASRMVEAYQKSLNKAKAGYLTPEPTFRDLLSAADNWIKKRKGSAEMTVSEIEGYKHNALFPSFTNGKKVIKKVESTRPDGPKY